MVKFINRLTGTVMWVADDRVEEYRAAGHRPAADPKPEIPAQEPEPEKPAQVPKRRKTTRK